MTAPKQLSAEHRRRIGRGVKRFHERKREEARRRQPLPRDLELWEAKGVVRPELHAVVNAARGEMLEVLDALGGENEVSPQRLALLREFVRLGVAGQLLMGLLLRDPDQSGLASRLATVASTRAKLLNLCGLDRATQDVPDLRQYLRDQQS